MVSLVVVLPTAISDKLLEAIDTLKLIDGDLPCRVIAVGAVALTCGICANTTGVGQHALRGVLVELPAAALSRQTVPKRVIVEDLAGPLLRRKLVDLVATHEISKFLERLRAMMGAGALPKVEGEPDSEIHARIDERLCRLGRHLEPLHPGLLEAALIAVVDDLMMQVPHGARKVRHVLVFGVIVGIALDTIHVEGLRFGCAGPQQR
mmetsp:Transcript_71186/g.231262  ORF Transcript_71186/g.231262 Transcript_71186/m.231262 type:complete len:207 (-) Transcript_71186:892-1512(-)